MASFYEFTQEEVALILEALRYWKTHQGTYGEQETRDYLDLLDKLERIEGRLDEQ